MVKGENSNPLVWYVAAGYGLPAGIEAHILHYATEMQRRGFGVKVRVFRPLPRKRHRFLAALDERGIPIVSFETLARGRSVMKAVVLFLPWLLYMMVVKRRRPDVSTFWLWLNVNEGVKELEKMLAKEQPAIVHIFGRLCTTAWARFPPARTIFHEMMTGSVDASWTPDEIADFRNLAQSAGRVFAPGKAIAANLAKDFGVTRRIDVIFTMSPDEAGPEMAKRKEERVKTGSAGESGNQEWATENKLRFGILCRLTEQKGISYLLEALKMYKERHGDVDFTFAGQGHMESAIREFTLKHGLTNVRIVRVKSAPEVLGKIDVFVHPSIADAMPVSIVEALMCGVPCVVTDVGGIPDLVRDGLDGFVIKPGKPEQILSRMERFSVMSEAELNGFRQRARRRYEDVCRPDSVGVVIEKEYRAIGCI
jgi:glycosyltransferase involved in cell wall biosynthesis